ncbi:MAG: hypothetical protein R3D00_31135 [Bacteroidia bacterium]
MAYLKLILTIVFGGFMIFAGIMHFVNPDIYMAFIPDFLPEKLINILAGIAEIAAGAAACIPRFRKWGTLAILVMMVAFLPLHIWDVFKEVPAVGTHEAALIRLPIQFVLILWAWYIYKK